MTTDETGNPEQRGGWQPTPQGEYDGDATAFVHLPPDVGLDGVPLEAPGHGYVPPHIPDPHATAQWNFHDALPADPAPTGGSEPTGQWAVPVARGDLPEESGEYHVGTPQSQGGDRPLPAWADGTAPATLPGGAAAPWAVPARPEPAEDPAAPPQGPAPEAGYAYGTDYGTAYGTDHATDHGTAYLPDHGTGHGTDHGTGHGPQDPAAPEPHPDGTAPAGQAPGQPDHAASEHAASDHAAPDLNAPGHPLPDHAAPDHAAAGSDATEPTPATAPAPTAGAAAAEPPAEAADPGSTSTEAPAPDGPTDPGTAPDDRPDAAPDDRPDAAPDAAPAAATEAQPVPVAPGDEHPHVSYVLRVNGADRPVTDAWIGESLLYVLRERLGLAGAKDGCSQGECGACNVQVDGRLVASCLVPAATAAGSEVRTVEGLAAGGEPSDVQRALARCGAVQCGFCIPGMAMTVHDLLEGNHAPSDVEARRALSGNLCRCTGYQGALRAVREVVAERQAAPRTGGSAGGTDEPHREVRIPHQLPHAHDGGTA
ncbi:2Fe-2S iron-sulfur cluster-binding protein [Streptomyces sp. DH12]|uniref:2Fe-2S iron-sulfur cluster-binding protein n=1 Tax=Streptomyces sp. DH12 TaxID=2857010 RepID=UPI001E3BB940|nr:2Fe-2S iron-sulfur cluster-binding protein [Streptomyces sp. DH12]